MSFNYGDTFIIDFTNASPVQKVLNRFSVSQVYAININYYTSL